MGGAVLSRARHPRHPTTRSGVIKEAWRRTFKRPDHRPICDHEDTSSRSTPEVVYALGREWGLEGRKAEPPWGLGFLSLRAFYRGYKDGQEERKATAAR